MSFSYILSKNSIKYVKNDQVLFCFDRIFLKGGDMELKRILIKMVKRVNDPEQIIRIYLRVKEIVERKECDGCKGKNPGID